MGEVAMGLNAFASDAVRTRPLRRPISIGLNLGPANIAKPLPPRRVWRYEYASGRVQVGRAKEELGRTGLMGEYHHTHPHKHGRRGLHEHRHGHRGTPPSRWPTLAPWQHWFGEHAHAHGDAADEATLTAPPTPGR